MDLDPLKLEAKGAKENTKLPVRNSHPKFVPFLVLNKKSERNKESGEK